MILAIQHSGSCVLANWLSVHTDCLDNAKLRRLDLAKTRVGLGFELGGTAHG